MGILSARKRTGGSGILVAGMCAVLAGSLGGCQEASDGGGTGYVATGETGLSAQEMDAIRDMMAQDWGVKPEDVHFTPTHVGASDVQIPLANFLGKALGKTTQRRASGVVSQDRISYVRVRTSVAGLKPILDEAIKIWNGSGAKIHILRVADNATAEITVSETREASVNGNANYTAYAEFPSGGAPGTFLRVRNISASDVYSWPNRSVSSVTRTLAHELGHNIGYTHTDQTSGTWIQGTADGTDPSSIMGSMAMSSPVFTFDDKMASRIVYPLDRKTELTHFGDVNGDGRKDLIVIGDNGISVALKMATGNNFHDITLWSYQFAKGQGWDITRHPRLFGDFNGDGRTDIIGFGETQGIVALSTGTGFASSVWTGNFTYSGGWRRNQHPILTGDFNGDNKTDIVGFANAGAIVALSTGSGFTESFWLNDMGYNHGWRVETHPRMVGDFNGDGRDDIVGFSNAGAIVGISNHTSAFATSYWLYDMGANAGWTVSEHPRIVGNFDGIGGDDILGFANAGCIVAKSTGSSFTTSSWLNDLGYNAGYRSARHLRSSGDFDGDGKDDVIAFSENATLVGKSNGNSFSLANWLNDFGYSQGWRIVETPRLLGDADGNGKTDVIALGYNNFIIGHSSGSAFAPHSALIYKTF